MGLWSCALRVSSSRSPASARYPGAYILPSSAGTWLRYCFHIIGLLTLFSQYAAVKVYDYHPPMPLPDPEAPDQSLGDCAICMDAIHVDPSLRHHSNEKDDWDVKATGTSAAKHKGRGGGAGGIILNAVQGVGGAVARKNYSLAPCHHLFVSFDLSQLCRPLLTRCTFSILIVLRRYA